MSEHAADERHDHEADEHGHRRQPPAIRSRIDGPSWLPSRGLRRAGNPVAVLAHQGQDLVAPGRIGPILGGHAVDGQGGELAPVFLARSTAGSSRSAVPGTTPGGPRSPCRVSTRTILSVALHLVFDRPVGSGIDPQSRPPSRPAARPTGPSPPHGRRGGTGGPGGPATAAASNRDRLSASSFMSNWSRITAEPEHRGHAGHQHDHLDDRDSPTRRFRRQSADPRDLGSS